MACRYKVVNRFNGEFWAFNAIDGRVVESSALYLIGCRMTVTEAEDFIYMELSDIAELNNGNVTLIIQD